MLSLYPLDFLKKEHSQRIKTKNERKQNDFSLKFTMFLLGALLSNLYISLSCFSNWIYQDKNGTKTAMFDIGTGGVAFEL